MEDFQDLNTDVTETTASVDSQPRKTTCAEIVDATLEIGLQALSAAPAQSPEWLHLEPVNLEMPAEMTEAVAAIAESAGEGLRGLVEGAGEIVGAVAEGAGEIVGAAGELIGGILGGL